LAEIISVPGLAEGVKMGVEFFGGAKIDQITPKWRAKNLQQEDFIKNLRRDCQKGNPDGISVSITFDPLEMERIIKEEGIEANILTKVPDHGQYQFGIVSILKAYPRLISGGTITEINGYQGVKTERKKAGIRIFSNLKWKNPVVGIPLQNGDTVYMTIAEKKLRKLELFKEVLKIGRGLIQSSFQFSYGYVSFPEIELSQISNIRWLSGLSFTAGGKKVEISHAYQLAKIKLGARPVPLSDCYKGKELVIDQPFYLWIERPGMIYPSLCAYVDQRDWRMRQ
jgi:hypothetical protein